MRLPRLRIRSRGLAGALLVTSVALASFATATAKSSYYTTWNNLYPGSLSDNNVISGTGLSCQLCHRDVSGGDNYNAYGWKMRQILNQGGSVANSITQSEPFDSDADPTGSTNLTEIDGDTQPGWTDGPNNTTYLGNGNTQQNQMPPGGILGNLDPCTGSTTTYCTAKVNSKGCTPAIGWTGTPSMSSPGTFDVTATNVMNNKNGILFYGISGRFNLPFQGGVLCVKPPTRRTPVQTSGGNPPPNDCSGSYSFDFNAWAQGGSDPNLAVGVQVNGQYWSRDPQSPSTTGLTDGIEFVLCP